MGLGEIAWKEQKKYRRPQIIYISHYRVVAASENLKRLPESWHAIKFHFKVVKVITSQMPPFNFAEMWVKQAVLVISFFPQTNCKVPLCPSPCLPPVSLVLPHCLNFRSIFLSFLTPSDFNLPLLFLSASHFLHLLVFSSSLLSFPPSFSAVEEAVCHAWPSVSERRIKSPSVGIKPPASSRNPIWKPPSGTDSSVETHTH